MSSMDTIDRIWQRIEMSLRGRPPATRVPLSLGSSEQAIKQLQGMLGVTLPDTFRASWLRHDGGVALELVTPMTLLSLQGITDWWQILERLRQDPDWVGQPPYYFTEEVVGSGWQTGPVQPVWWHHDWIPVAADRAGNLACLDLAPAPGGTVGQIIDWDHECGPSRVLYPSFERLLAAVAEQVENNNGNQTK